MQNSPNLNLHYLQPQQSQKHVTVNESLRRLDALAQTSVVSRTTTAQPGAPTDGVIYILPVGKTGAAWAAMADLALAYYVDGAWAELTPKEGWRCWVADADEFVVFDGAAWNEISGDVSSAPLFGVNTTADATNRLAVKSDAVLFNHDDVTPGSGDMRAKVNKATTADTGSHLFQTNASGRAEFGLIGNDDFTLKVSPDGATWKDALVVDKDNGHVGIGAASAGGRFEVANSATNFLSYSTSGQLSLRNDGGDRPRINLLDTGGFGEGYLDFYTYSGQTIPTCRWRGVDTGSFTGAHVFLTATGGAANTPLLERLRIAADGKVSIGAITAVCALDVDGPVRVKSYAKASLPSAAAGAGQIIYVSDEAGGAVLAFSDGANWRRVTDRAVVS